MMNYYAIDRTTRLSHHGILGMKWGVRRYQNPDGSLTPAGERRYGKGISGEEEYKRAGEYTPTLTTKDERDIYNTRAAWVGRKSANRYEYKQREKGVSKKAVSEEYHKELTRRMRNHVIGGLVIGGLASAAAIGLGSKYLSTRSFLSINNIAVSSFASKEGLKTVTGGFTLNPAKAIATGKAISDELLRRGMMGL